MESGPWGEHSYIIEGMRDRAEPSTQEPEWTRNEGDWEGIDNTQKMRYPIGNWTYRSQDWRDTNDHYWGGTRNHWRERHRPMKITGMVGKEVTGDMIGGGNGEM